MGSLSKIDFYFNCKIGLRDPFVVQQIKAERLLTTNSEQQMTLGKLKCFIRTYKIEF